MNHLPLVSVIIPTYNSQNSVCRAIDSCLNQTYKDIEIIVIDDGSTDNTKEILQKYSDEPRLKYAYQENQERSAARNHGLNIAKGDFIQFLDSDDVIYKDKLEKQVDFLYHNQTYIMVYCGSEYKDENNKVISTLEKKYQGKIQKKLLRGNFMTIHSPLIRKNNIRFSQELNMLEDWEYWILSIKDESVGYLDEILCAVYINTQNTNKYILSMLKGCIILYNRLLDNDDFSHLRLLLVSQKIKIYLRILKYSIFKLIDSLKTIDKNENLNE